MNEKSRFNKTMKDRSDLYGDYSRGVQLRATLVVSIKERYKEVHGKEMPQRDEEHFRDILQKLSRLAVSPDHIDSWHDIACYATLVEQDLIDEYGGEQYE